jgi:tetratricopeptide (TPR) repeat protein
VRALHARAVVCLRRRTPITCYHVLNPDNGTVNIPDALRTSQPPPPTMRSSVPPPIDPAGEVDANMYFSAAEVLLQRGDHRRAVLAAQKAMKLAPPRPEQEALYAWLLYQRSGAGAQVHPHVWDHLDRALCVDPDCAAAHRYKGMLLGRIGEVERARSHLQRALQLDAGDPETERELSLLERG